MMMTWLKDFRFALRVLKRRPGFTLTVLVTLALGVGATTALFGVYRKVFMEPLPMPHSNRLVVVQEKGGFGCCGPASGPDYLDWRDRNQSFSGIGALHTASFVLSGPMEPRHVRGLFVTASTFQLLGVDAALGRTLVPEDQSKQGVVVLSYSTWRNTLGGRPDVLGTSIDLDGTPYTVAGVMPQGFDVPSPWAGLGDYDFYLPLPDSWLTQSRQSHSYAVLARLRDGTSPEEAQTDMDRIMHDLATAYPATNGDRGAQVFMLHAYLFGNVGRQLGLILGAATLVLLIACGNVASLLLARSAGRETELAVRSALGASHGSVVRLLFTESLFLAMVGGVLGVLVAVLGVGSLKAVLPPTMPRVDQVTVGGWALLFGLGASVFTALAFGLVPALVAARTNLAAAVREGGYATRAPAKERLRSAFIVGQIALGLVLANGAVLLVRSYVAVHGQHYGFRPEGVLTMRLGPSGPRYKSGEDVDAYYRQVRGRVAALPGVTGVATVAGLPLGGQGNGNVWVEGRPPRSSAEEGPLVQQNSVTGNYFGVMEIPLLEGRMLQPDDTVTGNVGVIVNQRLAEEAWPGEDPLGKRFSFTDDPPNWLRVVGVVGNVRQRGPEYAPRGEVYTPFIQGWNVAQYLVVRTSGDPAALGPAARHAVLEIDPAQPPSAMTTMDDRMERAFAQRRFYTTLITMFAVVALFLAAAGVYGTVSYYVAMRTREMGIRAALGARETRIVALVVRRALRLAGWGLTVGLAGVAGSTSVVRGLVYGVHAVDVTTLVAGCVILGGTAVAASAVPALRATRVSPVLALRSR